MDVLHIGGVADGETMDLPGNVMAGRQSFKLAGDFPADPLRHHDYERQIFMARNEDGVESGLQVMVWVGLPKSAINVLIEARLKVKVVA